MGPDLDPNCLTLHLDSPGILVLENINFEQKADDKKVSKITYHAKSYVSPYSFHG